MLLLVYIFTKKLTNLHYFGNFLSTSWVKPILKDKREIKFKNKRKLQVLYIVYL